MLLPALQNDDGMVAVFNARCANTSKETSGRKTK
jgi:hypothetical protein